MADTDDGEALIWASGAIFVGALFLIVDGAFQRDWIDLGLGTAMATFAVLIPRAWSRRSGSGRITLNVLSAVVLLLVITGILRDRL